MNVLYDDFSAYEDLIECSKCTLYEDKLQDAAYWVASLQKRLYEEKFDQQDFEWDLGELCSILGMKFAPTKKIKITVSQ